MVVQFFGFNCNCVYGGAWSQIYQRVLSEIFWLDWSGINSSEKKKRKKWGKEKERG